ncbi:ectonucleoside triphosphate diphosphohydrolase 5-like [Leptopilina heterotoma]|uniref:ectonucleoside triphosphate diphosphohydrolase 5-like n=1 Tax=Leptopilina heterotoma TaxID=63436 RepID=UPI001CA7B73C|nr:ectonucleoside triphosphate diphosphohydrolase 5-like [Leptopilina heterotoma]
MGLRIILGERDDSYNSDRTSLKLELDDYDNMPNFNSSLIQRKMSKTIMRRYFTFILLGILFGYVAKANGLDSPDLGSEAIGSAGLSPDSEKLFYVVIVDAGSTGTRFFAFHFHTSSEDGSLILDKEAYNHKRPGLGSFANNPDEGIKILEILLNKTKPTIPQSEWIDTPIYLKATAGLRSLPRDKAEHILEVTREFLNSSGFQLNDESVSLMEGSDEGIFSWFTVNFLLGRFEKNSTQSTVAAIDLGGGSTQVTYRLDEEDRNDLNHSVITNLQAFNQNMTIFTQSYLGFGLMTARKAILIPPFAMTNEYGVIEVHSKCISPSTNTTWTFNDKEYQIMGQRENSSEINQNITEDEKNKGSNINFQDCLNLVKKLTSKIENKPVGLNKQDIYAFSGFYYKTYDTGLIDPRNGGIITVTNIREAALNICKNMTKNNPYRCLDLIYIYSLLTTGFGLKPETKLNIHASISDHQLSWTLGLALKLIQNTLGYLYKKE